MKERLEFVDIAKALGIYLMVLGHFQQSNWDLLPGNHSLTQWIYAFHMPFFFIVSGFVSRPKTINSLLDIKLWAEKMFCRYFLPYLMLMMILNGLDYSKFFDYIIPRQSALSKYHVLASWWLPCFISVQIMVTLKDQVVERIERYRSHVDGIFVIALLSSGLYLHSGRCDNMPYYVNIAMVGAGLLCLGRYMRQWCDKHKYLNAPPSKTCVFMIFAFILLSMMYDDNKTVYMVLGQYGNPILFLMNGMFGSIFLLALGRLITFNALKFIGENTIIILLYHGVIIKIISYLFLVRVEAITPPEFLFIWRIILSVFCMFLLVPVIFFINSYLPELAGKIKQSRSMVRN